jgi:hypothetical protein
MYAERIRKLNEDFPNHWWIVGLADIHMRSEHIERIRRKCVEKDAKGDCADFDLNRPWDVAFREAAADEGYWHREVDKKVLLHTSAITSAARVVDPGFGVLEEVSAGVHHGQAGGGPTSRAKRPRGQPSDSESGGSVEANQPAKRPKKGKKKKNAGSSTPAVAQRSGSPRNRKKADHKRPDGRFVRNSDGVEICFKYAHQSGGCQEPCPQKRAHICEWCREQHRSVDCGRKPSGWKP